MASIEHKKSVLSRLLRNEFDLLDNDLISFEDDANTLIEIAEENQLDELAEEMKKDLEFELKF